METLLTIVLWGLAGLLLVASLLPLSKLPIGGIRGLAFPRAQLLVLALVLAVILTLVQGGALGATAAALMLAVAAIQSVYIIKFTPIWRRQSLDAEAPLRADTARHVSLLAANVKKSNRAYDRLTGLITARSPDIVMAIEVDDDWITALEAGVGDAYPHWVRVPRDNGYGICVLSKLTLSQVEVSERVTKGVPSVSARVTLRGGEDFRLYVVHPEPPVIDHDTLGRDSEIALIGMAAEKDPLPAVVSGDLNDVAWSSTTRRFQRLSGLLDPRVGRGMYNTFSATMPLMRWPLEHLFHDPQFRLLDMDRLGKIGSDHFPMWFAIALAETGATAAEPEDMDAQERREVAQMIQEERGRNRDAIGSDWEDG